MLASLDWPMLSVVITDCFGGQTAQIIQDEWISADGKVMRGTLKSGEKQAKLLEQCRALAEQSPLAETIEHDCGHGFITTRQANLHNVLLSDIDNRWQHSGLRTLVVMNRETFAKSSQHTTNENCLLPE
jgi:hypothetical protein